MAVYQGSLTVKRRPKDGVPGGDGDPGMPGQVPIQKEWVVGDTHRFNDEIKDFIYVRGTSQNNSYWYTRTSKGDVVAGAAPVGGANVEGYTRVDWLRTLAVNVLLAEEANLANFVFKDGKLLSISGTVNGSSAVYSGQAGFVHNIVLDGQTGKIYAQDAEITGTVNATEGTLGNLTMQSGGAIYLPPTYSSQKGRLDNSGLALIYAGNNSQKIEWYSGPGAIAGQITCNSQGRLRLSSSFGIELSVDFLSFAPIRIMADGFNHKVDFGGAELNNIRKMSYIGQLNMAYSTHALAADSTYTLSSDTTLAIITSSGNNSKIHRILGGNNSIPSNGDVKIITSASPSVVHLASSHVDSNIRVPSNYGAGEFAIYDNTSVMLVYYGGYWRVQTDWGQ